MSGPPPRSGGYTLAHHIAQRLAHAGEDPYAGDREQYLVLENGEIVEFGRPLRDHRMFPGKSRGKTDRLAADLAALAAARGWADWRFWSVCRPTRKTQIADLEKDYREFSALLNTVFTYLREYCEFEYLMCGIHVRFDQSVGLFDLHAHFVCLVPDEHLEAVHRRLLTEFSRTHLPDEIVRSPEAVAKYIGQTFNLSEVVEWPEDALLAAWRLGGLGFHYTRTAGRFAEWRAENREAPDPHHQALLRKRRENRAETRYTGKAWDYQDRRLVTRDWRFGNKMIRGSLYQRAPKRVRSGDPPYRYPSAIAATTQTPPSTQSPHTPAVHVPSEVREQRSPLSSGPTTPVATPAQPPRRRTRDWCRRVFSAVRRTCIRFTTALSRFFHRRE